ESGMRAVALHTSGCAPALARHGPPAGASVPNSETLQTPMLLEQQKQLISLIQAAVAQSLPDAQATVLLERPKVAAHGDVATNVAMQLAKPARRNPRELAQAIVDALMAQPGAA